MARCKVKIKLNPPGEFEEHAKEIKEQFRNAGLVADVSEVDVVYGYGPHAEVSFTVASLDDRTQATLVRLAEQLRRSDKTRAEFLTTELWLTPSERDRVEEGGTMAAYDAVYRHDDERTQA